MHHNTSVLEKAKKFFYTLPPEDPLDQSNHKTFAIVLTISESEKDSSKKLKSYFMVDTGSDSTLHKKNYFFSKGKVLYSPIYTANEKYEEELEVFTRRFYHPEGIFLKQEKLYVSKSLEPFPVDGILGNSFFSNYIVFIDYPNFLVLYEPFEWLRLNQLEYEEIQAIQEIRTHWVFPVRIQGKSYLFLFDTGADYVVFDAELTKKFFYIKGRNISYMDFSGKLYESKIYFSPEICISNTLCSYNILGLSSSSFSSFLRNNKYKIHGILGMNWIKNYKFALDYVNWKIYITKK